MRLRRVGLDQAIADVLGLELAVRKALPGVRIGDGLGLTPSSSVICWGFTPLLVVTTRPLKPEDCSRRDIQPSKPRPGSTSTSPIAPARPGAWPERCSNIPTVFT